MARRFRFALEALLRLRKYQENQALAELAKVMARWNEQLSVMRQSEKLFAEETALFEKRHREAFSIELFKTYNLYLDRLEAESVVAAQKLETLRPELEAEQAKVREARRRKRVIELLRERRKKEHDDAERKIEAKELNEINSLRHRAGLLEKEDYESAAIRETGRGFEADLDDEDDGESIADESGESDQISEYFKQLGMEDPRGKRS
ncbi:MAG: flagellar export protein FliJ [Spirochaetia bacterium]|nr:flagellar export protein FliJ [Spirochaetia bacterium]